MKAEKIRGIDARSHAPGAGRAGTVVPAAFPDGMGQSEGLKKIPGAQERSRAHVDGAERKGVSSSAASAAPPPPSDPRPPREDRGKSRRSFSGLFKRKKK